MVGYGYGWVWLEIWFGMVGYGWVWLGMVGYGSIWFDDNMVEDRQALTTRHLPSTPTSIDIHHNGRRRGQYYSYYMDSKGIRT